MNTDNDISVGCFKKTYKDEFVFFVDLFIRDKTTLKVWIDVDMPTKYRPFIKVPDNSWKPTTCSFLCKTIFIDISSKDSNEIVKAIISEFIPMLIQIDAAIEESNQIINGFIEENIIPRLQTWDMQY